MGGGAGASEEQASLSSLNRAASPSEQFPSSDPDTLGGGGRVKPRDDQTWATILDELHRAIDDTSTDEDTSARAANSAPTTSMAYLAPPVGAPRGRKRLRSRGRSLSVGAAPSTFEAPTESDVPMHLEHADRSPPSALGVGHGHGHSHPFHLHITSSARAPEPRPPHTVTPRHSSPALLASPIQLMSASARRGSPPFSSPGLPISSSVPRDFAAQAVPGNPRRQATITSARTPARPASAPTQFSPSPGSGSDAPLFPSLPASPESPGAWLRSPTGPRRFRSDESVSDTIMFTPRQLDFEHDADARFTTFGRRLEWNAFEMDDEAEAAADRAASRRPEAGRLQGIGLGPAFSPPTVCTRDEPVSPAFGLETEPGVGTS